MEKRSKNGAPCQPLPPLLPPNNSHHPTCLQSLLHLSLLVALSFLSLSLLGRTTSTAGQQGTHKHFASISNLITQSRRSLSRHLLVYDILTEVMTVWSPDQHTAPATSVLWCPGSSTTALLHPLHVYLSLCNDDAVTSSVISTPSFSSSFTSFLDGLIQFLPLPV